MEVISPSRLNPDAPMFVPQAYQAVEDFSEEWWALVHSCPWFRDYWLQERYLDPSSDDLLLLPDSLDDVVFDDWLSFDGGYYSTDQQEEYRGKELAKVGNMRWQNGRALAQAPRYTEKAPKLVRAKVSPRTIQQPK